MLPIIVREDTLSDPEESARRMFDILDEQGSHGGNGTVTITFALGDLMVTTFDQNPNEVYYDFCTGSYFSPYVTQIGLYNEANQLVVVGKLSRPLPISLQTDTTFVVNFDT